MTSAALLLEGEQLTFGDQAQRLWPAQRPVLAVRLRSHRAVTKVGKRESPTIEEHGGSVNGMLAANNHGSAFALSMPVGICK